MSSVFPIHLPIEQAYRRRVLFAAEIVDAVTLEPVTRGLDVRATGLKRTPIINSSGYFVWLEEGGQQPQDVVIEASKTPYESITVPALLQPDSSIRIELAPRYDYPFPAGVTAMRGGLIEARVNSPVPVAGAEIWLQWIDDNAAGTTWVDAPTHSHSGDKGDFAALLRLSSQQQPRLNADGSLRARLRVRWSAEVRTSAEFSLREGRVSGPSLPFAWNELVP
jgi:hypothetical protein